MIKGDIVKLKQDNLIKIGYLNTTIKKELYSGRFVISHIFKKGTLEHYYMESLLKSDLYTKEQLEDKEVYILYSMDVPNKSMSICVIDDDMIKISDAEPSKIYDNSDKSIIKSIMMAYVIFHDQFDLDTDTTNLEDKLDRNIKLNKSELKRLLHVVETVNSLSCNDPLYDRYMEDDIIEWIEDNEDFSLEDYIENMIEN